MGYVLVTLLTLKSRSVRVAHLPLSLACTVKDIGECVFEELHDFHYARLDMDVELAWDSIQRFKSSGDLAAAFEEGGYRFPEGWCNDGDISKHVPLRFRT